MEKQSVKELIDLPATELMKKMEVARQGAIDAGANWAKVHGDYKAIKEMLPTFLAEIQREIFHSEEMTMSQARMEALAHPKYKEKVEEMNRLQQKSHYLETEYKSFKESISAISAISYVRNNELKLAM